MRGEKLHRDLCLDKLVSVRLCVGMYMGVQVISEAKRPLGALELVTDAVSRSAWCGALTLVV